MSDKNTKSGGSMFLTLLAISFIVLKLCGVINWLWVWVLSPMWIPLTLLILSGVIDIFILIRKSKKAKTKWEEKMQQMEANIKKLDKLKKSNPNLN